MEKKCQDIFFYVVHYKACYGFAPAWEDIASNCNTTIERAQYWLNELNKRGYIKLYIFPDASYDCKILIDPTRRWKVAIRFVDGQPIVESEVPVEVHIWKTAVPLKLLSGEMKK